eukprot:TRINITY_DN509_c0_g1_i2.p1 TRINITY_DN509_c0_g1~~TRINITY_DN509_c0_g1_i2.p1  ORF type:complete len:342 (-),score=70.28 TRINITY_DN509_c0_g1_i2:146-1171(-)
MHLLRNIVLATGLAVGFASSSPEAVCTGDSCPASARSAALLQASVFSKTVGSEGKKGCACPQDFSYCWSFDNSCYKNKHSWKSTHVCSGKCSEKETQKARGKVCACSREHPYCAKNGWCYEDDDEIWWSDQVCPGTCSHSLPKGSASTGADTSRLGPVTVAPEATPAPTKPTKAPEDPEEKKRETETPEPTEAPTPPPPTPPPPKPPPAESPPRSHGKGPATGPRNPTDGGSVYGAVPPPDRTATSEPANPSGVPGSIGIKTKEAVGEPPVKTSGSMYGAVPPPVKVSGSMYGAVPHSGAQTTLSPDFGSHVPTTTPHAPTSGTQTEPAPRKDWLSKMGIN